MAKPKLKRTKSAAVERLLRRGRGATMAELVRSTGWQPHSVLAFLSGMRKAGADIAKEERTEGSTAYRIRASERTTASSGS